MLVGSRRRRRCLSGCRRVRIRWLRGVRLADGCSACWSCSDAHERDAEVRAVSDAADTVSVVETARLVHEVRYEAGGHQRHVGEEQLEVRDAGAVVHVHAVPAQPAVLHEDKGAQIAKDCSSNTLRHAAVVF
jgi:hypothetical protein